MRAWKAWLGLSLTALLGSDAYGVMLDVSYGQQKTKMKQSSSDSSDGTQSGSSNDDLGRTTDIAAHILFSLPNLKEVSVGAFGMNRTFSLNGNSVFDDLTYGGVVYGPELRLAYDFGPVRAFLRADYLMGTYKMKGTITARQKFELESKEKTSGYAGALGFELPLDPQVSILAEYAMGEETVALQSVTLKADGVELASSDGAGSDKIHYKMNGAVFGLGFRF